MKKEQRKAFEKEISASITKLLSKHNAKAADKIRKHIKDAGKTISKKFAKALKHQEDKAPAKKVSPVKRAAAATLKVPAKKRAAIKKATE
jgi:hypothetical protein